MFGMKTIDTVIRIWVKMNKNTNGKMLWILDLKFG